MANVISHLRCAYALLVVTTVLCRVQNLTEQQMLKYYFNCKLYTPSLKVSCLTVKIHTNSHAWSDQVQELSIYSSVQSHLLHPYDHAIEVRTFGCHMVCTIQIGTITTAVSQDLQANSLPALKCVSLRSSHPHCEIHVSPIVFGYVEAALD